MEGKHIDAVLNGAVFAALLFALSGSVRGRVSELMLSKGVSHALSITELSAFLRAAATTAVIA